MASNALELFKWIGDESTGQRAIEEMITTKKLESSFLDYKVGDKLDEKDIPKIWGKSLSAYANTGGGVVIWGVHCKKVKDPVTGKMQLDEPTGTALHSNPAALRERLADLLKTSTTDVVEGVQILAVKFSGGTGGCVVCFIPEGKNKPYRAMFDNNYYMRQPDRMEVIPHSLLRSLFYPTSAPELDVWVTGNFPGTISDALTVVDLYVSVKNVGTASAKETFIKLQTSIPMLMTSFHGREWQEQPEIVRQPADEEANFRFFSIQSIHPTLQQKVCTLRAKITRLERLDNKPIVLSFEVYLFDGKSKKLSVKFLPHEMTMPREREAMPIEQTK